MDDGIHQGQPAGAKPRRPTVADVAAQAGVSVATVDRVLNRRLPVRAGTARRVLMAAEALGYHATSLIRAQVEAPLSTCRLGFILQRRSNPFYQQLAQHLTTAAAVSAHPPVIDFVDEFDAQTLVERMRALGRKVDAMGVVAVDHPRVSEEIDALREAGIPVLALLSDLSAPARAGYVGLDPRKAGRTAAWAITRLAKGPGAVAIFVGSHRYLDHDLREISLRSYLREHAPEFGLLEPVVDLEQPDVAYDATLVLLKRHPELVGLYSAGGGTPGILRALLEAGRARDVVMVANELTAVTRSALIDGVVDLVIGTPTAELAARTVATLTEAARSGTIPTALQIMLPFTIHGPENL